MVLKEAYRYQNHLARLLDMVNSHLSSTRNVLVVKSEHMRSKSQPGATDEVTDNLADRALSVPVDHIVRFGLALIDEKARVSEAIDVAKAIYCPDIDRGLSVNRSRQSFLASLKGLARLKNRERMTTGTALCFNVEGNQVSYRYDIRETTTLDFDKGAVKAIINDLQKVCDEMSNRADYSLTSVLVKVEPRFDINDSFEDLVEAFSKSLGETPAE